MQFTFIYEINKFNPLLHDGVRVGSKSANLRRTRDLLLPRLLSGQIELKA